MSARNRIFRVVHAHAQAELRAFLSSDFAATGMAEGTLAPTQILSSPDDLSVLPELSESVLGLEHKPVAFPGYPYEWSPAMLHAAAALTVRLARAALAAGYRLKDATPYNIMFEGARPIFIDILSFEKDDDLDALWRPYAQFVRTFIYPLLASRYFGLRLDEILLVNRDGLEPKRMFSLCSRLRLIRPPFLASVTLPTLFSGGRESTDRYRPRRARDAGEAAFLRTRLLRRAERLLRSARPLRRKTSGVAYMESDHNYTRAEMAAKVWFVRQTLEDVRPRFVLDIGCNTGHFSLLAARAGATVVAIDRDPDVVDELWNAASADSLDILPLVVDLTRPSASCGWANTECASFLDRAQGKFDCVLMLALLHHLVVGERIPLERIFELLARLTTGTAIVEYVDPADSQFQLIARGRDALHAGLTPVVFETAAGHYFEIVSQHATAPHRRLYTLRKRSA